MPLQEPVNIQSEIRYTRRDLDCSKLTTRTFRKAAVAVLDQTVMSASEVAAFFGHANPSMTQNMYMNTLKSDAQPARPWDSSSQD